MTIALPPPYTVTTSNSHISWGPFWIKISEDPWQKYYEFQITFFFASEIVFHYHMLE